MASMTLGVLWPVAVLEAIKAWDRFTAMRRADPTGATQAEPVSTTTSRKN